MTTQAGEQGNSRLPGDLLGRWTRLVARLEAIEQGWTGDGDGFHIDWSDLVVLNAYLTEDAEFNKWHGAWGNETDNTTTIASLTARVAELEETLRFAATYVGYEARACPLCKYENGKFIEHCQMHKNMMSAARVMAQQEKEIASLTARCEKLEQIVERAKKWLPDAELDGTYDDE